MGRNGTGKSTLLHHLVGLRRPQRSAVEVLGHTRRAGFAASEAIRLVGLRAPGPGGAAVRRHCGSRMPRQRPRRQACQGTTRTMLESIVAGISDQTHPKDLSEGQRLALALAIVLAPEPPLLLLDEPTRGLDYRAKGRRPTSSGSFAARGHCVVVATHDVELVAEVADRVVVLADGEVITDGPVRSVVCHSTALPPRSCPSAEHEVVRKPAKHHAGAHPHRRAETHGSGPNQTDYMLHFFEKTIRNGWAPLPHTTRLPTLRPLRQRGGIEPIWALINAIEGEDDHAAYPTGSSERHPNPVLERAFRSHAAMTARRPHQLRRRDCQRASLQLPLWPVRGV